MTSTLRSIKTEQIVDKIANTHPLPKKDIVLLSFFIRDMFELEIQYYRKPKGTRALEFNP